MSERKFSPQIIAFCCAHSAYKAIDRTGCMRLRYPPNIRIIQVPCAGTVSVLHILKAFENGADGVLVLGCEEGACHHICGNTRAKERVDYSNILLGEVGIDGGRVQMFNLAPEMAPRFAQIANEMDERLREMGPARKEGVTK